MYRHVATYHLDLGQLWRCPVSWCTVWKGTPQDCMDHVRGAHDVPWDIKSARLEKCVPPWTVQHLVCMDPLKPCHSMVSTDVLLFFVSQAAAPSQGDMVSPVQSSPVSMRHACSSEQESESPRKTRRAHRQIRPIRVLEGSVSVSDLRL